MDDRELRGGGCIMDYHEQRAGKFLALLSEQQDRLNRERKRRHWPDAFITATLVACLLVAVSIVYLSLDAKINAVGSTANQVGLLKQQMAALDQRQHITALGTRIDQLSAARDLLETEVAQLKQDIETLEAVQKKPSPARKR